MVPHEFKFRQPPWTCGRASVSCKGSASLESVRNEFPHMGGPFTFSNVILANLSITSQIRPVFMTRTIPTRIKSPKTSWLCPVAKWPSGFEPGLCTSDAIPTSLLGQDRRVICLGVRSNKGTAATVQKVEPSLAFSRSSFHPSTHFFT
jgi:hypothetical protein